MDTSTIYEDEDLTIEVTVVGRLHNNVFNVSPKDGTHAVLIDAAEPLPELVEWARSRNVTTILTTHNHPDHIGGIPAMRAAQIRVGIGTSDTLNTGTVDFEIEHGNQFPIGSTEFVAIHTPGHTAGSTCFELVGKNVVFTGDTLFPGGPGRTTNPTDFAQIMESLDGLFARFGDEVQILPGHGASTSFGAERPSVEEWRARGW